MHGRIQRQLKMKVVTADNLQGGSCRPTPMQWLQCCSLQLKLQSALQQNYVTSMVYVQRMICNTKTQKHNNKYKIAAHCTGTGQKKQNVTFETQSAEAHKRT